MTFQHGMKLIWLLHAVIFQADLETWLKLDQIQTKNDHLNRNWNYQLNKARHKAAYVPVQWSDIFIAGHLGTTFLYAVSEYQLTRTARTVLVHVPNSRRGIPRAAHSQNKHLNYLTHERICNIGILTLITKLAICHAKWDMWILIISAEEAMFLPLFVCLSRIAGRVFKWFMPWLHVK